MVLLGFSVTVQAISYKYDSLGRVVEITYDSGQKVTYTYDAGGNILTVNNMTPDATLLGITLDKDAYTLKIGQVHKTVVKANYSRGTKNVTNSGVMFSSTNNAVATVDSTGKVTGVGTGSANIVVSYKGISTMAKVTVISNSGNGGKKGNSGSGNSGGGFYPATPPTDYINDQQTAVIQELQQCIQLLKELNGETKVVDQLIKDLQNFYEKTGSTFKQIWEAVQLPELVLPSNS